MGPRNGARTLDHWGHHSKLHKIKYGTYNCNKTIHKQDIQVKSMPKQQCIFVPF